MHTDKGPWDSPIRSIGIAAVIPAMLLLLYWPIRLAWADYLSRQNSVEALERATRQSPGDADLHLRLADAEQAAGRDPIPALTAASTLDPGNASAWVRLGLAAEMGGDFHTAEAMLLKAAQVNHQFAPRWELANYYFRRSDQAGFWPSVRASLQMGYGDLSPVFQLCWHMSSPAPVILSRAVPNRREVLNAYTQFLLNTGRMADSEPVAARLAAIAAAEDEPILVSWCNGQLDIGEATAAMSVWNSLCTRHLIPFTPLDTAGDTITDGHLLTAFPGGGFGWRVPISPGVTVGRNPSPQYLWIALSGDQPESCTPLLQFVPLVPRAGYTLRFEYNTSELPPASGLRWSVFDAKTGIDLATDSPYLSSVDWKKDALHFKAPIGGLVRLTLICQRVPGSTRIEGSVALRRVWLERS